VWSLIVLPLVALLTAILSGMIGMGGGMLLLAVMFSFMSHAEAIPAHGTVQLISNSTRTLAFLKHVDWRTVGRFLIGVVPGSLAGIAVLGWTTGLASSESYLKMLVGVYILLSLVVPRSRKGDPTQGPWWDFPLLGLLAGAAAFTVGAVGPLIAPLFARRSFVKERLVATKAVCQSLLHLAKIPVFLTLRQYPDLATLGVVTLLMGIVVIPGTLIGKQMLGRLSERGFVRLYQASLLVAGLKVLIFDGVLRLARAA
jgi:uncharacterized membrane protein YfcA